MKKVILLINLILGLQVVLVSADECLLTDILERNWFKQEGEERKDSGMNKGGIYTDKAGDKWFVKDYTDAKQSNADEFLGGRLMKMMLGRNVADVKLVKGNGEFVASKLLKGFVPVIKADLSDKKVVGEERLVVIMDWIGLEDRHGGNQGYVFDGDVATASRVDYDSVFQFEDPKNPEKVVIRLSQMTRPDFEKIEEVVEEIVKLDEDVVTGLIWSSLCQLEAVESRIDVDEETSRWDIIFTRKQKFKEILPIVTHVKEGLAAVRQKDKGKVLTASLTSKQKHKDLVEIFGKPFVYIAFVNGGAEEIGYLCDEMKKDVNIQDKYGRTPLFDIARHGRIEDAQCLIDHGAEVDAKDLSMRTPLFEAAEHSTKEMVEQLVKWGADINQLSKKGKTPLFYAAEYGKFEVVEYLMSLEHIKKNVQDVKGKTALFDAARNGRSDMVESLIKHGVDVCLTNKEGKTAKYYAVGKAHKDVVDLLTNAGDHADYQEWSTPKDNWGVWKDSVEEK